MPANPANKEHINFFVYISFFLGFILVATIIYMDYRINETKNHFEQAVLSSKTASKNAYEKASTVERNLNDFEDYYRQHKVDIDRLIKQEEK